MVDAMLIGVLSFVHKRAGIFVLCASGCAGSMGTPVYDEDARVDGRADVFTSFDVSSQRCSATGGQGRLRVSVSLAPTLVERTADVWLAVHCDDAAQPIRIVRWDRSATQSIEGLGPGMYRVFGASFLAPGTWSTTTTLGGVSTSAVSLTLDANGVPIANVVSSSASGDGGGVTPDAAIADAAVKDVVDELPVRTRWETRVALRETAGGPSLGTVTITTRPASDTEIEIRAVVQNLCAQPPCRPLRLSTIEARTTNREAPVGLSQGVFDSPTLESGASTATMRPLMLRGSLPDAERALQVVVFAQTASMAVAR
jgi:hypothetical protein